MTRLLTCWTLAVVLACILAGCSGDSNPPSPTPAEADQESTATADPTSTPKPKLEAINLNPSILDQFPAVERSCLLFAMEEDYVDDIFRTHRTPNADDFETIVGCISGDTVVALFLGVLADPLGSVSGETSACVVDRLEKVEKDVLVMAMFGGDDEVVLGYDLEAIEDLEAYRG